MSPCLNQQHLHGLLYKNLVPSKCASIHETPQKRFRFSGQGGTTRMLSTHQRHFWSGRWTFWQKDATGIHRKRRRRFRRRRWTSGSGAGAAAGANRAGAHAAAGANNAKPMQQQKPTPQQEQPVQEHTVVANIFCCCQSLFHLVKNDATATFPGRLIMNKRI